MTKIQTAQCYKSIQYEVSSELIVKNSQFICILSPVSTEEHALEKLACIKKRHKTARHNCYAYRLYEQNRFRFSDDGEPAKTAGFPLYEQLCAAELNNVICVVTRYFGGTLLGTGGLVRAYSSACALAIQQAHIQSFVPCISYRLTIPYSAYNSVQYRFQQLHIKQLHAEYTELITLELLCQQQYEPQLTELIREHLRGLNYNFTEVNKYFAPC